jgi:predicted O-methyltransferase YrrM
MALDMNDGELCRRVSEVRDRKFSNTWFPKGIQPIWEKHVKPWIDERECVRYLELGVCEGASMLWVLENADVIKAVGVDHFTAPRNNERQRAAFDTYRENCFHNLRPHLRENRGPVSIEESDTFEWLIRYLADGHRNGFDFIYVDADHRAVEALQDLVLCWKLLDIGGLIVIDDLQKVWHRQPRVRFAQRAFDDVYQGRYRYDYAFRQGRQIGYIKAAD